MNEDVNGNRKLEIGKEVSYMKGGKVENCSKIKYENRSLAQGTDEMRRIWKGYFKDLCNIDTQEHTQSTLWI